MHDRRQFPRIDVRLPVTLRHGGRLIPATALNVSCGGMLLRTDTSDVTATANIEVVVDLSEVEKDVTLRGEVVRVEGSDAAHVGVRFTNLFALGHQTLERFLKNRQRLQ